MMTQSGTWRRWAIVALVAGLLPLTAYGQSINATLSGVVTDPSGAVVPGATATLTSVARATALTATTSEVGQYSFPNLPQGSYELKVSATGFREFIQRGISLNSSQLARVDVLLELGQSAQAVEVMANASPLNYENAEIKQAVTANQVASLPLIVSGRMRTVMAFIVILPGVNMGSNTGWAAARLNGGLGNGGDESTLDGVTMQEGLLNQGGLISFSDMPMPPETVEEVSLLTANYEPQYGKTTGAVINVSTKTGTNAFHGHVYEYARNRLFNTRQWNVAKKPKNIENDLGGGVGGPVKLPLAWSGNRKTYFFVHWSAYRSRGSTTLPTYTVPTAAMRNGDFSEWPNPIYDPATTRSNDGSPLTSGNLIRDQFMGCDPINNPQPNVICPARFAGTLPTEWMTVAGQVLDPTKPGVTQNFTGTGRAGSWSNLNRWDMRFDHEIGTSDRITVTEHSGKIHATTESDFPAQLTEGNTRVGDHFRTPRVNWDHTFSPNLLTHTAFGYLNWNTTTYNYSDAFVGLVPGIAGVYSHVNQPALNFTDYNGWGGNEGISTDRPAYVWNNMTTWVHGRHTLKVGGEYRWFSYPQSITANGSGTFNFSTLTTGVPTSVAAKSGNAMASFLLGEVSSASATFRTVDRTIPQADSWAMFLGDTWKATSKLSVTLGIRWDVARPSWEKKNVFSYLDTLGPNPGAAGRPGRLVFAGSDWGAASSGQRYPEDTFYKGFAPRIGIAYSLSPKTVIRTGYGMFLGQAYYPSWQGGISTDGFNTTAAAESSTGGFVPAFNLVDGFPQNFTLPPNLDVTAFNGQNTDAPQYGVGSWRPLDANRLPYTQQWNFTLERQFTPNFYISTAYVGNKGTRLASAVNPINVLSPSAFAMGSQLNDQFTPNSGMTQLDGVNIPYAGWIEQMKACKPTVGQAMLPFPQFCGKVMGLNENLGTSAYHSFQFKAEKRFSHGFWFLSSYTWSKVMTTSDNMQSWLEARGINPAYRAKNWALSTQDSPHQLALSTMYQLPFGKGKRFANTGGVANVLVGGWQITSIFRYGSGMPLVFTTGSCNIPSLLFATCYPAITGSLYTTDKGSFDPNLAAGATARLFDSTALESTGLVNGEWYPGAGARVSNERGWAYKNQDFGIHKETGITERLKFIFRADVFNMWNLHSFQNSVNTNVSSANFGKWGGGVTAPRNIQLSGHIRF